MRKFRIWMMAMAALIVAGFASCKDDVDKIDNGGTNGGIADAYLSVMINIPSGSSTKGAEDSGLTETGTTDEFEVKDLTLYLFDDATDVFKARINFTSADLTSTSDGNYASAKKGIKSGDYKVVAIVNGGAFAPTYTEDVENIDDLLTSPMLNLAAYAPTSGLMTGVPAEGLMMASRTDDGSGNSVPVVLLSVSPFNTIDNPAPLKIEVERTVAKLALATAVADNVYTINSLTDGECVITMTDYSVVNLRNTGYLFRHAYDPATPATYYGNIFNGGVANPYLYVLDPQTLDKTIDINDEIDAAGYAGWYRNHVTSPINWTGWIANTTVGTFDMLGYCLENTAIKESQRNGYSTGVIFRGNIVPTVVFEDDGTGLDVTDVLTYTPGDDLYYHGGRFYETLNAMAIDPSNTFNLAFLTGLAPDDYVDFGIFKYTGGNCYYTYWIKHNPSTTDMDVMEFAVVRNNVYNMQINSISRPGSSSVVINPNDPNETDDLFMQVELVVRPWIVRTNDISF